jgi:dTDP-4-dehydrorhamnose reductase
VLVSAAAYTDVNKAESEPDVAECINGQAAGLLAARARALGIPIIHLSTDYVFDGEKPGPYRENDPLNPLSAYGQSKAKGEQAVAAAHPRHVIVRTSWVYSPFGRNFVRTMLDIARRHPEIRVVSDQVGNPTAAADIATAILSVARQLRGDDDQRYGLFHMSATGTASWAEFATAIFKASAERGGPSARVVPISTAEYPTPAKRPRNSRLDCSKIANTYGITLPDWRTSLGPCIDRLLEPGA